MRYPVFEWPLPCRLGCLLMSLLFPLVAAAGEGPEFDDEHPRKVSTVLPAELVVGELWTVQEKVIPYEGLFQFQVETQWGTFPVYGEAMLRLRLKELRATAELQGISSTEAALAGAGTSIKKSFVRLGNTVIHPKRTARAVPQGTRRLFRKLNRYARKIGEALSGSDEDEDEEEKIDSDPSSSAQKAAVWLARKYGGVGSKLRDRARDVGVDPYTSNELLGDELERLSRAEAVGSVSSKFLLPVMAGALGLMADAANIAYTRDWREVFTHNGKLMTEMGVSDELVLDFEVNPFYTPMTQTVVVAMLDAMEGVENRHLVIEQATFLENESEALFFLESVMLAEWYHREQTPLVSFHADTLIPVATNGRGKLVAFTASDYFYWTEEAAAMSREFTASYADHPGGRELVTADFVSQRARAGVEALGWTVLSDLRRTYDVEVPWGIQDHD